MKPSPVILQLLPELRSGGVERGTLEVAQAIVAHGWTALVASFGGPMVEALEATGAVHITLPLKSKNPITIWRNARRITQLIRTHDVDIIHARSRAPAWSGYLAARRANIPFVTTFHGHYRIGNALKRWYNGVMARGDRVIAISEFIKQHILDNYPVNATRIRIIHRGVDTELFDPAAVSREDIATLRAQWNVPDGVPVILLPGRFTRWKGQDVLIRALSLLPHRDFFCVLLGDDKGHGGYREELERLIAELDLSAQVTIAPHTSEMPTALRVADVVVSASTEPEAFGRIAIEAQAMERVVIATDHGGARETVIPGTTGWRVMPGSSEAMAKALAECLAMDVVVRAAMGRAARAHVSGHFSTPRMCADTLATYNELLTTRTRERILVIKHSALGDFILATGPFKSIRAHHKDAHITLLTTRPYAKFAEKSGFFDEVWLDSRPKPWNIIRTWKLRKRLVNGHFARVYDLQTSTRSSAYFRFFPADDKPEWSGIARGGSHPHDGPERIRMHTIDRQRAQLNIAGIGQVFTPDISWMSSDLSHFPLLARYALLIPGGAPHRPEKRWTHEGFTHIARWLAGEGIQPVLIGASAEETDLADIQASVPEVLNLCRQTSLENIASLARGAILVLGNDTGPMHIAAAATNAPCLVLFSHASNPALCAPHGVHVHTLQAKSLPMLTTERVRKKLTSLLSSSKSTAAPAAFCEYKFMEL